MFRRITKIAAVFAVLMSIGSMPSWADYQSGVAAFERGNYESARKILAPLARDGDGNAQYYLGLMYSEGRGVTRDTGAAMEWFTCAAEGSASFGKKSKASRLRANLAESAGLSGEATCRYAPSDPKLSEQAQQALYFLVRDSFLEKLLFLPGDLLVMATIALANSSDMPWLADAVLAACSMTQGWITAGIGLIIWCFFGWMLIRVVSGVQGRVPSSGKTERRRTKTPKKGPRRRNDKNLNARLHFETK
jgi:hypothetical protein